MEKQEIITFVEGVLANARSVKANSHQYVGNITPILRSYFDRAYGAVEFFGRLVYKTRPEDEVEIYARWNDEWRPEFETLVYDL